MAASAFEMIGPKHLQFKVHSHLMAPEEYAFYNFKDEQFDILMDVLKNTTTYGLDCVAQSKFSLPVSSQN